VGGFVGARLTPGVETEVADFCDKGKAAGNLLVAVEVHEADGKPNPADAERILAEVGAETMRAGESTCCVPHENGEVVTRLGPWRQAFLAFLPAFRFLTRFWITSTISWTSFLIGRFLDDRLAFFFADFFLAM
jgi:hypothetical protein